MTETQYHWVYDYLSGYKLVPVQAPVSIGTFAEVPNGALAQNIYVSPRHRLGAFR
jgi:hypothetical protein